MEQVISKVDWESFLSAHDLVQTDLRFHGGYYKGTEEHNCHSPRKEWGEGAFIGNGMIGAMILKDSPQDLAWELGRNDVVAHNHLSGIDWSVPRVPIGDMVLRPRGRIREETMRLSLWHAEATGLMTTDQGTLEWRSIAHAQMDCLMIEWNSTGSEGASVGFRPRHGVSPRLEFVPHNLSRKYLPPPPLQLYQQGTQLSIQTFVKEEEDGTVISEGACVVAWKEVNFSESHGVVYVSIANSYFDESAIDVALKTIDSASKLSLDTFLKTHRAKWHDYYPASFISIPDKYWEGIYWIQMYKLASAVRGDSPVLDNQGPWLTQSAWPGTWWNLNVQLSYSSVYKANRLSIGESLIGNLERYHESLRQNAIPIGLDDGAYIDRQSSFNLISPCLKPDFEYGNLPWALHNVWRHYRSTMDEAFLRDRLYPLLRASMNVYLHLSFRGEDGHLHLPKTVSPEYPGPENSTAYPTEDTNYDLALFRWGCLALLEANDRLHLSDPLEDRWREVLRDLIPYPIDHNGFKVGKDVPFAVSHRHYSHLLMFFPLHLVHDDQPEYSDVIKKSISHWIDLMGGLQGYSYTGAACMAATRGDGNQTLAYLTEFRRFLYPNTMYAELSPVIETPLSSAECIHYMVMQCWGDTIRVFPAVPDEWKEISFGKLLAEGAFEVSGRWRKGKTEFVVIKSLAGAPLKIIPNLLGPLETSGERNFSIKEISPGVYEIDLKQGESILLYTGSLPEEIGIGPVSCL
ncbi:hypothetical protein GC096_24370 [Paenibacillus sp. LMG 31461]|uniref:Alpha-L-fucosidase n=1 Tax=Paenibacillus plantarum TaxID=2654975 RepID=A0ABX1XFG8_9BACL|nr:hypothetical protein [Paenibacillus plantarum]NOU67184.1 hypothetical protein [Paenibacillus plantarum]